MLLFRNNPWIGLADETPGCRR